MNVLKYRMKGTESIDKAAWTKKILYTFCDLYNKSINMRIRPNTYFDKTS